MNLQQRVQADVDERSRQNEDLFIDKFTQVFDEAPTGYETIRNRYGIFYVIDDIAFKAYTDRLNPDLNRLLVVTDEGYRAVHRPADLAEMTTVPPADFDNVFTDDRGGPNRYYLNDVWRAEPVNE